MANQNQETRLAVTDGQIVTQVSGWANEYLRPFYHGRNFDGWKADAVLAIAQNKSLRDCLTNAMDAALLMRALQLNAASGLSLRPQAGEAALVAYRGNKGLTVNHIPMKNGLIKVSMRTGKVARVESGTVYEKDDFHASKSSTGDGYDWNIAIDERGAPRGYFALVKLADDTSVLEYQTRAQVWEHALKYGNGRVWDDQAKKYKNEFYSDSAWGKSFDGMAEKTVIRSVLNSLHLPEMEELFEAEDAAAEAMRDVTEPPPPPHKGASAEDLEAELVRREAGERAAKDLAERAAAGEAAKYGNAPGAPPEDGNPELF